jgi:predicted secreted protein
MFGYNITFKVNGKTLVGRTKDTLSIDAKTKDSITKDDKGQTNHAVTGHDVKFSAAGLVDVTTGDATKLNNDEIMELALKVGDDALIPIQYIKANGATYGGTAIITGYSEDSDSEADATYSLNMQITGSFTKVVE